MKRSELPSQKKYRENHPSVSFRLKKGDKARLDAIVRVTGKTLSQFITEFIYDKMEPYEEMTELRCGIIDYSNWVDRLEKEEKFTLPCSVCGKPMKFSSNDSNWKTEVYPVLRRSFAKWMHIACERK
jgi:hypothetical protein